MVEPGLLRDNLDIRALPSFSCSFWASILGLEAGLEVAGEVSPETLPPGFVDEWSFKTFIVS